MSLAAGDRSARCAIFVGVFSPSFGVSIVERGDQFHPDSPPSFSDIPANKNGAGPTGGRVSVIDAEFADGISIIPCRSEPVGNAVR